MKHHAVVGGLYDETMDTVSEYVRQVGHAVATESVKGVGVLLNEPNWDAVYLDIRDIDAQDMAEAAIQEGFPVAFFGKENILHAELREAGMTENVRVIIADPDSKVVMQKAVELMEETEGPIRATLISEDKTKEWQSSYGDATFVLPHGSILLNAESAPQWAFREDVDVVVGDTTGNLIAANTAFGPAIHSYPASKCGHRTFCIPVL